MKSGSRRPLPPGAVSARFRSFPHRVPSMRSKWRICAQSDSGGCEGDCRIYQLDCGEWWRGCAVAIFNCTITQADLPSLALSSNKQLWSIILQIEIRKNKYFPPAGGESAVCKWICHRLCEVRRRRVRSCGERYRRSHAHTHAKSVHVSRLAYITSRSPCFGNFCLEKKVSNALCLGLYMDHANLTWCGKKSSSGGRRFFGRGAGFAGWESCVISFDKLARSPQQETFPTALFSHVPTIDLNPFRTLIRPGLKTRHAATPRRVVLGIRALL